MALSETTAQFLADQGSQDLSPTRLTDLPALVKLFRGAAPGGPASPDPKRLTYLSALLEVISLADERLYEHYRALIDLFQGEIALLDREELLALEAWAPLRRRAVKMHLLPEDLYGDSPARPHLGLPEAFLRIKEGPRS